MVSSIILVFAINPDNNLSSQVGISVVCTTIDHPKLLRIMTSAHKSSDCDNLKHTPRPFQLWVTLHDFLDISQ